MIKCAGHTLSTCLTPVHSLVLKNHGRLFPNLNYTNLSKLRKLHRYHQRCQFHKESTMVATCYPPPWFSIAPMMELTDNHYRTLARILSKNTWPYSEMIAAETTVFQKGNLDRFLKFSPEQHPIVLQIGGDDLENIAKAVQLANPYGYDEINLNCGCPSPKVAGKGCFGVRPMLDPKFVAHAMTVFLQIQMLLLVSNAELVSITMICIMNSVSYQSPMRHFIIHSRKALLNGISPRENRSIPPLKYEFFYALQRDFPDLRFTINGGINTIDDVNAALREGAHGVTVGRTAYHNPWNVLGHVDSAIYGTPFSTITRRQVLQKLQVYGVLETYEPKPNL